MTMTSIVMDSRNTGWHGSDPHGYSGSPSCDSKLDDPLPTHKCMKNRIEMAQGVPETTQGAPSQIHRHATHHKFSFSRSPFSFFFTTGGVTPFSEAVIGTENAQGARNASLS